MCISIIIIIIIITIARPAEIRGRPERAQGPSRQGRFLPPRSCYEIVQRANGIIVL